MELCYIFRNPPELCYGDLHTKFYSGPGPVFVPSLDFIGPVKSVISLGPTALKYCNTPNLYTEIRRYPDPANIKANYPDPANSEKIISGHSLMVVRRFEPWTEDDTRYSTSY